MLPTDGSHLFLIIIEFAIYYLRKTLITGLVENMLICTFSNSNPWSFTPKARALSLTLRDLKFSNKKSNARSSMRNNNIFEKEN